MSKKYIPFSPPDISENEISAVCGVLRSGWITTGAVTKKFEEKLAEFCNVPRVVCLSSATAAEELNLRVLGTGPGDEVIVPAYTYTSTASAVIHTGAKVVFVDIQEDGDEITNSPEMDYYAAESLVNANTKAIIPVDIGGIMCNYGRINEIAESSKNLFRPSNKIQEAIGHIAVIADCAHSLGAEQNSKKAGGGGGLILRRIVFMLLRILLLQKAAHQHGRV